MEVGCEQFDVGLGNAQVLEYLGTYLVSWLGRYLERLARVPKMPVYP